MTPAQRRGVDHVEDAARMIVSECAGYPYFIQESGRVLWREVKRSPISVEDFTSVRDLIISELDRRFFKGRFESVTDAEERCLAAMAELSDAPYRTADIAGAGYRSRGSTSEPRDGLLPKDLIWSPRHGFVDFSVTHFSQYIRPTTVCRSRLTFATADPVPIEVCRR